MDIEFHPQHCINAVTYIPPDKWTFKLIRLFRKNKQNVENKFEKCVSVCVCVHL